MDDSLRIVCEMPQMLWEDFKNALAELCEEELHWRPVAEANTINVIIRHLRIEAEWHLDSLAHGAPMPTVIAPVSQATTARGAAAVFRGEPDISQLSGGKEIPQDDRRKRAWQ